MSSLVSLLYFLVIGLLAGFIASLLMKRRRMGVLACLIVGVIGSLLGGFVFRLIGLAAYGLIGSLVMAILGSIILLFLLRFIHR